MENNHLKYLLKAPCSFRIIFVHKATSECCRLSFVSQCIKGYEGLIWRNTYLFVCFLGVFHVLCFRRSMNVYQLVARTALPRSSGSRFPFSVVTTPNAGENSNTCCSCCVAFRPHWVWDYQTCLLFFIHLHVDRRDLVILQPKTGMNRLNDTAYVPNKIV